MEVVDGRPRIPVSALIELLAESCADYMDGDLSGWSSCLWDGDTGHLVLDYQADEYSPNSSATYRFLLVDPELP